MREFEYRSVLKQITAYLLVEPDTNEGRAGRMPWVAERLAPWALRDEPRMYGRASMRPEDLMACMNLAWKASDKIDAFKGKHSLDLVIRSMLLAQMPHQLSHGVGDFARQIDLVRRLAPESALRRVLDASLGLPADDYLQLAIPFWLRTEDRMGDAFAPEYLKALAAAFGVPNVNAFLQTFVIYRGRVLKEMGVPTEDEWFQPNLMYRYPFVIHDQELFFFGVPGMRRHFEYAFSDIVVRSEDSRARELFEKWFEDYVGRALNRTGETVLAEAEVRKKFNVVGSCCDFAVLTSEAVILLEAKNKALVHNLPAAERAGTYQSKLKATVVKAESQLANVEAHVRRIPEFANLEVQKVTVTYGDLLLGSGRFLYDGEKNESDLPLIMSIDQLERLVDAVSLGNCTVNAFFAEFKRRRNVPAERLFSPGQLLGLPPFSAVRQPKHSLDCFNEFLEKLFERLGGQDATVVVPARLDV
jgi:hypothetical protein